MGCCPICLEFTLFPCMLIMLTKSEEGSLGLLKDVALSFNAEETGTRMEPINKPLPCFLFDSSNITKFLEKGEFGIYFIKLTFRIK